MIFFYNHFQVDSGVLSVHNGVHEMLIQCIVFFFTLFFFMAKRMFQGVYGELISFEMYVML